SCVSFCLIRRNLTLLPKKIVVFIFSYCLNCSRNYDYNLVKSNKFLNMERHIVHCDLDSFFVSVERLHNSSLVGKPVLVGGKSDRAVVASCSYETRKFGIHSAMPMRLALRLCPDAIVVQGDHDSYSYHSNIVTEIIKENVPLFEKASIDEHYFDLTGMDKFFGCWKWAQELRQRIITQTGLPISFGLSVNKT